MKKTGIVLLIALIITMPLTGCGGSPNPVSQNNAASTETTATSTSSTTPTSTTPDSTTSIQINVPRKIEYTKGSLPQVFEKAVDDGFVVVVGFYDPDEYISKKVADAVEEVIAPQDYRDQIVYLNYEMSGTASTKVAKLTTALGAKYTPNLTIIDGDKNIVFEDSGYIELDYFEHALYNAVYKDKSPAETVD